MRLSLTRITQVARLDTDRKSDCLLWSSVGQMPIDPEKLLRPSDFGALTEASR